MSNSPGYKALLIRADARALIDEAKKVHAEREGIDFNYSQFVSWLCKRYMNEVSKTEQ
jgi:hypothetical protein